MSIANQLETKNFGFWVDGRPSLSVQLNSTKLSDFSFWVDGQPYVFLYPGEVKKGLFFIFMPL